jgi:hypothetical protein
MQSALAGLQDWSMILHYGYASRTEMITKPRAERWLNITTSPLFLLSDRMGSLLFAQGEVTSSNIQIPLVITQDYLNSKLETNYSVQPPPDYLKLGWACRIGVVMVDDDTDLSMYPAVIIPEDMVTIPSSVRNARHHAANAKLLENLSDILPNQSTEAITSTTGQTRIDAKTNTFTISTSKSETLLLSNGAQEAKATLVSVDGNTDVATCFVGAIDSQPLRESKQMLVLYLTDLKNTGTVISPTSEEGRPVIHDAGELPYLLQQGEVTFTIRLPDRSLPRIWELKYDGTRADEISPIRTNDGFSFIARAVTSNDTYGGYEIAWE